MKLAHWQGVHVQTVKDSVQCIKSWGELREQEKQDMGDHTSCCSAGFSNSFSQNPRIWSNNHTKTGSQEEEPGKATKPGEEVGKIPQRNNRTWFISKFSFFDTKKFVHSNFIFVENPSRIYWPLLVNRHEALNPLYCCCYLLLFQVAACIAERVGGAAALFKVIVSSSLDFFDCNVVSILSSVIFTQSLCIFLLVEPIFSSLWQCWSNYCWFDSFFRLGLHSPFLQVLVWGNHWCHLPTFFSVFQSLC